MAQEVVAFPVGRCTQNRGITMTVVFGGPGTPTTPDTEKEEILSLMYILLGKKVIFLEDKEEIKPHILCILYCYASGRNWFFVYVFSLSVGMFLVKVQRGESSYLELELLLIFLIIRCCSLRQHKSPILLVRTPLLGIW